MRLNWGALAYPAVVALCALLIPAAWLIDSVRHLARKRREGRLTRAERREFRAARRAYRDGIGTALSDAPEQAAEEKARQS